MHRAIILAGGKGERLRPYTEDRPKPMVPLLGNPLISYTIRWLVSHGIKDITICCGHMHHVIRDFFGDGSRLQAKLHFLVEDEPLGRGGAFRMAMENMEPSDEPILALNGDLFTNLNLSEMLEYHKAQGGLATIATVPLMSQYGIVDISEDGCVNGFREKPQLPFWINAGIYIFDPSLKELLPHKGDHEERTFPHLAESGKLKAYKTRAFWKSVDTVKDLTELRNECESMFFGAFFQSQGSFLP